MTGNVFFDAVVIFLLAYAIINIFYEVGEFFTNRFSRYRPKDCIVLPLEHGAESLECDVRLAMKRSCDLRCALVIVDLSLDSDEKMILWRLTDESDNVVVSLPEELPDKIKTAEAINATL